ncbi:uncharacterized protein METZ01_LOCUS389303, partial [marine metagenome]
AIIGKNVFNIVKFFCHFKGSIPFPCAFMRAWIAASFVVFNFLAIE